jgi:hypothetical protein
MNSLMYVITFAEINVWSMCWCIWFHLIDIKSSSKDLVKCALDQQKTALVHNATFKDYKSQLAFYLNTKYVNQLPTGTQIRNPKSANKKCQMNNIYNVYFRWITAFLNKIRLFKTRTTIKQRASGGTHSPRPIAPYLRLACRGLSSIRYKQQRSVRGWTLCWSCSNPGIWRPWSKSWGAAPSASACASCALALKQWNVSKNGWKSLTWVGVQQITSQRHCSWERIWNHYVTDERIQRNSQFKSLNINKWEWVGHEPKEWTGQRTDNKFRNINFRVPKAEKFVCALKRGSVGKQKSRGPQI